MRRPLLFAAAASAALFAASTVRADNPASMVVAPGAAAPGTDASSAELDAPPTRRGGFVVGAFYGLGIAGSAGYPNDLNVIDDPAYYSASGFVLGGGGGGFLMGALSDWLSFGFWFGAAIFNNPSWHSIGEGGGLRLELFPLFGLGGTLRDLGLFTQVGIGGTELVYRDKPGVSSDGVGSAVGAGFFHETLQWRAGRGHFALGPSLEYDAVISQPIERHGMLLGARLVWYVAK